ncbi:unnamed protein product [Amoebophrya sp. A25]|nr:unnamed protein product [Amoebophrya sp. A25]|eukprot:GSA25T00004417001.1
MYPEEIRHAWSVYLRDLGLWSAGQRVEDVRAGVRTVAFFLRAIGIVSVGPHVSSTSVSTSRDVHLENRAHGRNKGSRSNSSPVRFTSGSTFEEVTSSPVKFFQHDRNLLMYLYLESKQRTGSGNEEGHFAADDVVEIVEALTNSEVERVRVGAALSRMPSKGAFLDTARSIGLLPGLKLANAEMEFLSFLLEQKEEPGKTDAAGKEEKSCSASKEIFSSSGQQKNTMQSRTKKDDESFAAMLKYLGYH